MHVLCEQRETYTPHTGWCRLQAQYVRHAGQALRNCGGRLLRDAPDVPTCQCCGSLFRNIQRWLPVIGSPTPSNQVVKFATL
jgi:hypothetical protein